MQLAKRMNIPIFLVGHVTKEGSIAGPKVLEHIVDTVLYFEGDRHHSYRILRAVKNRFGSTNEVAIFEMHDIGLVQVTNPSELFLSDDSQMIPGSVVVPCMEGTRPLLVEIQALVSDSHQFGHPRRVSTFIDSNRVALLIAIFEKRLGVSLASEDVFINLVGGIKINEPSADLGVIVAMMSSLRNKLITPGIVIMGEVGLGGEVRSIAHCDRRLQEAVRLGFTKCIVPHKSKVDSFEGTQVIGVKHIEEAIEESLED
jgi:DNA repair protein RadA/Sms